MDIKDCDIIKELKEWDEDEMETEYKTTHLFHA